MTFTVSLALRVLLTAFVHKWAHQDALPMMSGITACPPRHDPGVTWGSHTATPTWTSPKLSPNRRAAG